MDFNIFLPGVGEPLGVVPILTNAGAALFPAIVASFGTFFMLLLKPKELIKFCKEKPGVPITLGIVGFGLYAMIMWMPMPGAGGAGSEAGPRGKRAVNSTGASSGVYVDWTQIALARIKSKKQGSIQKTTEAPTSLSSSITKTEIPVIFRGGPKRLGAIGNGPEGKLEMAWDYYPSWIDDDGTVEVEDGSMILSSPIIHGDRVIAASCVLDPPDSYGIVFCVDSKTGKTIWSVDQVEGEELKGFFSSPAVTADGKYVIIGQGLHPDTNCRLICIDTEKGTVHWTVLTELHLESSPAIADGVVYIGAGAIEDPITKKAKGHTGYVMAVNIADGKELWKHDVIDPESSPIIEDGILYIGSGFNGKAVVALRTGTDEELKKAGEQRVLWKMEAPYPVTGAVTFVDGNIVVGGGNGDFVFRDPDPAGVVMSIDAKTGELAWQMKMPDAVLGAVAAGKYLICPVAAGKVIALDPKSGKKVWETVISGKAPVLAGVAVASNSVYAVSHDGYMAKLELDTGKLINKTYINAANAPGEQGLSISSPMVANGKIYVGSETGGLRCYVGVAE
ncbi:MAG: PQQ-like beta-propeller repeat protein [Lentisphaeraceae bacterium]|nr:PQQ-like beta-propeller repeat protein [Lentisphaeraceae bacterium]